MPSSKHATDPDYHEFILKAGIGNTARWKGVRLQGAAASLRPGEIRRGENIRPTGDGYIERGGQAKFITTPAGAKIDGIWDAGDTGAPD